MYGIYKEENKKFQTIADIKIMKNVKILVLLDLPQSEVHKI